MNTRKTLCAMFAAIMIAFVCPVTATADTQTFPGYDEHDVKALLAFAAQKPNKDDLNWSVNDSPIYWDCVKWVKVDGIYYLETLDISAYKHQFFKNLDLSGCKQLKRLYLECVRINSINVSNCAKLEEFSVWDKHEVHDDLYQKGILPLPLSKVDLTGCVSLRSLVVRSTNITELDLSSCKNMEEAFIYSNEKLQSLDFTNCKKLKAAFCAVNLNLTSLRVENLKNLELLEFYGGKVSEINLSGLSGLINLHCGGNELTRLDLKDCVNLQDLSCYGNKLTALDLSPCPKLTGLLRCEENNLETLKIKNPKLEEIKCSNNNLRKLSISNSPALKKINCTYNALTELKISNCSNLEEINCTYNALTKLDISGCLKVSSIGCGSNNLTELDVSGIPSLKMLNCWYNNISKLDITKNTKLEYLGMSNNNISKLDITKNTKLEYVECWDTKIKSKDDIIGYRDDVELELETPDWSMFGLE